MSGKIILEGAAKLIGKGFCKKDFATDANGIQCDPYSPDATCFCMLGALQRAAKDAGIDYMDEACRDARIALRSIVGDVISDKNDAQHTNADMVIAWFKQAANSCPS